MKPSIITLKQKLNDNFIFFIGRFDATNCPDNVVILFKVTGVIINCLNILLIQIFPFREPAFGFCWTWLSLIVMILLKTVSFNNSAVNALNASKGLFFFLSLAFIWDPLTVFQFICFRLSRIIIKFDSGDPRPWLVRVDWLP